MKRLFFLGALCLTFLGYSQGCHVRVLLEELPVVAGTLWSLTSQSNVTVSDAKEGLKRQTITAHHLIFSLDEKGSIFLNGKKIMSSYIKIEPTSGTLLFKHHSYSGSFFIIKLPDKVLLINKLPLEDYVDCGVRWEMLPQWPLEALEAGAIAYRTYVAHTLKVSRARQKRIKDEVWYDIRCTSVHQVYKGTHHCSTVHEAVKNTKGLIVTYNKNPITALYDACCGGSIPSMRSNFDFEKAPYLARSYPCNYCKKCKFYTWSHAYSYKEIADLLSPYLELATPISDIKIGQSDKDGCVQTMMIKCKNTWHTLSVTKFKNCIKSLKSSTFTFSKKSRRITFKGKGYGHQVGFCQWGAYGLALEGWDYKRILRFYYPGTTFMKLEGDA